MHAPPQNAPSLVGRVFGNQFRLEALLGRGGMAEVYVAEQLGLGRRVVLKLLLSPAWSSPELEERFRREARVLAQLNHPNIVQLYSFGRSDDGIAYLAMEYIDGRTLTATINESSGALPEAWVLHVLEQICSALTEAHAHGIVHRDLKPDNVMTMERHGRPAFVKVLDFGIAKLTQESQDPRLTRTGAIVGTPQYMAPEQVREKPVDARTDIYALGLIGYELLTGQAPFQAETTMELMMRVLSAEATPPSRRPGGGMVSPATEALIMRCLEKEPEHRFQTSTELAEALAAIPRGSLSNAPLPPPRAADRVSLPSLTLDELDYDSLRATSIRPRGTRTFTATLAVLSLFGGVAAAIYFLATAEPAKRPDPNDPGANEPEPLALREWVQGIPFPSGTEYEKFEATFVDARVAAPVDEVLAFYREQLRSKWSAVQDVEAGVLVDDPSAPLENVTVTPDRSGSRVFIKRRSAK